MVTESQSRVSFHMQTTFPMGWQTPFQQSITTDRMPLYPHTDSLVARRQDQLRRKVDLSGVPLAQGNRFYVNTLERLIDTSPKFKTIVPNNEQVFSFEIDPAFRYDTKCTTIVVPEKIKGWKKHKPEVDHDSLNQVINESLARRERLMAMRLKARAINPDATSGEDLLSALLISRAETRHQAAVASWTRTATTSEPLARIRREVSAPVKLFARLATVVGVSNALPEPPQARASRMRSGSKRKPSASDMRRKMHNWNWFKTAFDTCCTAASVVIAIWLCFPLSSVAAPILKDLLK